MAYYVNVDEGPQDPGLSQFTPSFGSSLVNTFASSVGGNLSYLGYQYGRNLYADSTEKLDNDTARQMVKESGVDLKIPDSGYTREALQQLIDRKHEQAAIEYNQARTPWSWYGSPIRGAVSLLGGLLDPINVAASFVPVLGEANAARLIAGAGNSVLARGAVRAGIGAAQGAAGMAVLEPALYGVHSQLQDDYGMADALKDIAFGGLLGGGLHSVGGALADALRTGPDPYARFTGMTTDEIRGVMDFQKAAQTGGDVVTAMQGLSEKQRRAAGLPPSMDTIMGGTSDVAPQAAPLDVPDVDAEQQIGRLDEQHQPTMRDMLGKARQLKPGYDQALNEIADEVGGKAITAPIKSASRAVDKTLTDYKGDPSRLKDLLRGTIEVDTPEQAMKVVDAIRQRFDVVDKGSRNLFAPDANPVDGYRDAKLNVSIDGHVAEIQVNMPEMLAAKSGPGHALYERRQAIERTVASKNRAYTAAELKEVARLNAEMRAIYEPAWTSATNRRNSLSEMRDPLRQTDSMGNGRGSEESNAAQPGEPPQNMATGTASTSKNSAPLGNDSGSFTGITSDSSIPDVAKAATDSVPANAADRVAQATPQQRELALRTAVADMAQGRAPDVADIFDPNATPDQLIARTQRQMEPDSLAVGDRAASDAAAAKVADAPKGDRLVQAEDLTAKSVDQMRQVADNLVQGGMSREKVDAILAELKPFDEAIADGEALAKAAQAAAICGIRQ
jgi:hypothetical protein